MQAATIDFDLAIVGGGFAGSLLAMVARRLGKSVLLLERHKHPRFVIGESSTPLANLLLEEIALRHDLPRLLPLCKWGTWQQHLPGIACGLKRGFSFYHHGPGHPPWSPDPHRSRELLVAASPSDAIADTHWYRPDLDHFLFKEAAALGAEAIEEARLDPPEFLPASVRLSGVTPAGPLHARARWLLDATGPRGYLHQSLGLANATPTHFPRTEAVFGHFHGVERWADIHPPDAPVPFPPDDAALHHVFDDGWTWVLRFNNGLTSAGFARRTGPGPARSPDDAWHAWIQRCPDVARCLAHASPARPLSFLPQLPFRASQASGPRWLMLPIAAGFVDPLLSTGFPLTLLGILRLSEALDRPWKDALPAELGSETLLDLDAAFDLVGALYEAMPAFDAFRDLLMLYFAAAIWTETARRLHKPGLAPGFLLRGHPGFAADLQACTRLARLHQWADLHPRARKAIEPFDLAGLGDPSRRHRHGCEQAPLLANAGRLGATPAEMAAMLARSGFTPGCPQPTHRNSPLGTPTLPRG